MSEETKRILIITIGIFLSVITGTYIYTQNTGFNACYDQYLSDWKKRASYAADDSDLMNSVRKGAVELCG